VCRFARAEFARDYGSGEFVVRKVGRGVGPCPCADCREDRSRDPMEERRPRRLPLSAAQAEQQRVHDAYLVRELALWNALVWGPEAAAEAARFRPDDRPADSAWALLRAVLEALGILSPLSPEHDPLRLADRWLEVCPSHGPPAEAEAVGIALPDCTGGAVVVT
jgi:hypothetical protein